MHVIAGWMSKEGKSAAPSVLGTGHRSSSFPTLGGQELLWLEVEIRGSNIWQLVGDLLRGNNHVQAPEDHLLLPSA